MKKIFHNKIIIFFGIILTIVFLPQVSLAATINSASCEQSDMQVAIDVAQDGDTVMVPAGSCMITTPIVITNKNITVQGAGIDTTTLTTNITSGTRPGGV